jgi:hypothetical protein
MTNMRAMPDHASLGFAALSTNLQEQFAATCSLESRKVNARSGAATFGVKQSVVLPTSTEPQNSGSGKGGLPMRSGFRRLALSAAKPNAAE